MPPRRQSSRARYADYTRRRRDDRAWATSSPEEKGPKKDRLKRSRSFFDLFRSFWTLLRGDGGGHRRAVYLALCTVSIVTVIGLAIPASTKVTIDYILTDNPGPSGFPAWVRDAVPFDATSREAWLWALGTVMVGLALIGVLLGTVGRWQMTRVTKQIQTHLRQMAFAHAVTLPLHRIHHHKSGGMASLLREDAGLAGELLFSMIYNPWRAVVQLAGTLTILAFVDWRMLLGAFLLVPAVWVTHKTYIARIRPFYRDQKLVRQNIDSTTTEAFGGMRVVRGFGRERAESGRFTGAQHYMTRIEVATWWWSRVIEVAWAVLIPVASSAVLIYGGTRVVRGDLTIGDVMMFSTYLLMLLGPLETLTSTATSIQSNLAALDRVLDLLAEDPEFGGKRDGLPVSRAASHGRIELRDVWFSYPKAAKRTTAETAGTAAADAPAGANGAAVPAPPAEPEPVIRGVSLAIAPGETIALVGPSGSGKTTLCNLIARFYDPSRGSVFLDGVDLRDVDVTAYRSVLGIVEQDVFLFDGTIADNIAYARRDASDAEIEDAARAANADGFIQDLDKGYDTVVGERGVRLSGGQKQRIAIARALLADPLILILDEATSNLDSESEALIQRSLQTLVRGRTCFVIAHRLSTVRTADRIVVMEAGRVIEVGSHDQLLALGGRYADLLRLQVEGHAALQPAPALRRA